ncbi:MAG: putative quinol monooxygenase [Humidesulfovibrio sp.]|uniref:putative quinol monooxygenase n=1 Tax=Humidesulfovibrio sp. TaxID=2910988 RepID=UPI0027FD4572|nr:putative quinol monooxygenase [Humidesulfovibrio sp.]MDQ7836828.1 putative quinol monooxygenase [Humidesulfovibrio sp.]
MTVEQNTLTVMAHLSFNEPVNATVLQALAEVKAATVLEPGCLEYHAHLHADDPRRVSFYERWRDQTSFEAHLAMPHLAVFISAIGDLLAGAPEVTRLQRLG